MRRQHQAWQREATKELATERTAAALERYERAGMVHAHATKDEAKSGLVGGWDCDRRTEPERSQVMLAYTRADVRDAQRAGAREGACGRRAWGGSPDQDGAGRAAVRGPATG